MGNKFQFFIAGVQFRPKEEIARAIDQMDIGDELLLVPEPDNKYDPNAIKILSHVFDPASDEYDLVFIGYVPKKYSKLIAVLIIAGDIECTVTQVNPEAKSHMMIEVLVEGPTQTEE